MARQKPTSEEVMRSFREIRSDLDKANDFLEKIDQNQLYFQQVINNQKEQIVSGKIASLRDQQDFVPQSFAEEYMKKAKINLDPSKAKDYPILFQLYLDKHFNQDIHEIRNFMTKHQYEFIIMDNIEKQLTGLSNSLFFLKLPKTKENILETYEQIRNTGQHQILSEDKADKIESQLKKISPKQVRTDYAENREDYLQHLKTTYYQDVSGVSAEHFQKIKKFKQPLKDVRKILSAYREELEKGNLAIDSIKDEEVGKRLAATSLEEFSELYEELKGRDIEYYHSQGIYTIKEVAATLPEFMLGGNELQNKMHRLVDRYIQEIKISIGIHFDTENQDYYHTNLLKILSFLKNNTELIQRYELLNKHFETSGLERLNTLQIFESYYDLQQYYDSEKKFNRDYEKIDGFFAQNKELIAGLKETPLDRPAISDQAVWQDYEANAAQYYAILERYFNTEQHYASDDASRKHISNKILEEIDNFELNEVSLLATLRSWQDFGAKYALVQHKALIGDEMGLGKTLISIAVMAHLYEEEKRHFVVVCPSSLMENWVRETRQHSYLQPMKIHGRNRDVDFETWKDQGGVLITTYETAQRLDFDSVEKIDVFTADEAHYAKNPGAKRTKNVRKLADKSDYILFLTGTALENRQSEMTELIRALDRPLAQEISNPAIQNRPELYRKKIASVYLRRTKEDVKLELPPLTQIEEWEAFGDQEFKNYKDAVATGNFMAMRRSAWTGGSTNKSPKLERLKELAEEAHDNEQKIIIFTFFKDVIRVIETNLPEYVFGTISGDIPIPERQDIIDDFKASKDKNVIVCQINTAAHGLNMQFANMVVFCEPQIKPSLEAQAVARAYRMGQTDKVFVYRLLTVNSVDELMMEMLESKQNLFDQFADKSYINEQAKIDQTSAEKEEVPEEITGSIKNKIINMEQARLEQEDSKFEIKVLES